MKKIEKLDLKKTCLDTYHPAIVASVVKINEIIESFNGFIESVEPVKPKETEIKPCRYCGIKGTAYQEHNGLFRASCGNYDCDYNMQTFEYSDKEDAIISWNKWA